MQGGKELGFWMSTALVVGNIIGMGIFLLPASLAPFGFNALLGWGITVVGMSVLARVFARLAREFPQADGPYAYIRDNLGDAPAFLAIWCYWVPCGSPTPRWRLPWSATWLRSSRQWPASPALVALAMLWLFVAVSLLGARTGGGVQVFTTLLKLLPMAAIIALGAWILFTEPSAYTRNLPATPIALHD